MNKSVDIDWLMFQRKALIGKYLVEFKSWGDTSLIHSVGQITEMIVNDFHLQIKTDTEAWLAVGFDADPQPKIEMVDNTILIDHIALGIRYQIVMGK